MLKRWMTWVSLGQNVLNVYAAWALPQHLNDQPDAAVTVPSPATDTISEAARQVGLVVSIGVNERDGGALYNAQLLFDADSALIQRRRKISPTYHERMIWARETVRACAPSIARPATSVSWRAGSLTILWPGTR